MSEHVRGCSLLHVVSVIGVARVVVGMLLSMLLKVCMDAMLCTFAVVLSRPGPSNAYSVEFVPQEIGPIDAADVAMALPSLRIPGNLIFLEVQGFRDFPCEACFP